MENARCPECGEQKGQCGYVRDIGVDVDMYMLRCGACGYEESEAICGSSTLSICPYCDVSLTEHIRSAKKSGIKGVDFSGEAVRVHYHLQKPWGVPDVDGIIDVFYDSFDELSEPPERVGFGMNWREKIVVPEFVGKIIFIFDSYQERSGGPNEHDIYGPYRGE